jgi:DNA-binding NtrC family response regulator
MKVKKVLIVDDDVAVTNYFLVFLTQTERFEATVVNDSREVPDLLGRVQFDAIILDLDMPDPSGMDILKLLAERGDRTPVIILTGVGDVALAVKAMKLGAFDYLTKPVDDGHLLSVLDGAVEQGALGRTISGLPPEPRREDLVHGTEFEAFVSRDPRMIRMLHEADRMASGDAPVLIIGERGSGRERLALAIHDASPRRERPFAMLVPASVEPREDLRAMLFGRARTWGNAAEERRGLLEEDSDGSYVVTNGGMFACGLPCGLPWRMGRASPGGRPRDLR